MNVATFVAEIFQNELPFRVEAYDGSSANPTTGSSATGVTLKILRPEAISRVLTHPGELGVARAYVAGDLDVDGELDALFDLKVPPVREILNPRHLRSLLRAVGPSVLRPVAPPTIEARPRGVVHSRSRDRQSVTHHYDVSNRFYEMVLGPSMTYSCALFATPDDTLELAQSRKVDLVARKLDLRPGMRLLDVGCGWGAMGIHAALNYGVHVVGVTLSEPQRRFAHDRARLAGVADLVDFRVQDYRDVNDGPFDAISSIGMSEHVGRKALASYTQSMWNSLKPGGRFLNHAIGRPLTYRDESRSSRVSQSLRQLPSTIVARFGPKTGSQFIDRYVFPDGELHEVGTLVSQFQAHGFEVRHVESLREHYALTLRHWVDNLNKRFDEAVEEVGVERARVWRLYMTMSALAFEHHHLEIHQVLNVRPDHGRSDMSLRSDFEPTF